MHRFKTLILASAATLSVLGLGLSACGPRPEPAAPPAAVSANDNAMMHHPSPDGGPAAAFRSDESTMDERMMAAVGATADHTWAMKMVEHHRGAIAMSRTVLGESSDPDIRRMASKVVEAQTTEVADLETWLADHGGHQPGSVNPFATADRSMHERMMGVTGSTVDLVWARKMRAHHQGAIDMNEILLSSSKDPTLRKMAQMMIDMQRKEIAELDKWLAGHMTS